LPILATSAGVIPDGAAAMRSGTSSCRGGAPADPGGLSDFGTEAGEVAGPEKDGEDPAAATPTGGLTVIVYWPGPEVTPASAGAASPAIVRHATAHAAAAKAAWRTGTGRISTMY
jgi:hypothetical protein